MHQRPFSGPKKHADEAVVKKEIYDSELEMIAQDKRFYLDETGNCLNIPPLYRRSQKGQRVYDKRPSSPGKRVNTLAILSEEGIKAPYHYVGSLSAYRKVTP
jgi:hypothetical protein